jgi:hypothetical protein
VLLLGVGCVAGATFALYGQQLLDRALAQVINFPVVPALAAGAELISLAVVTVPTRRRQRWRRSVGRSPRPGRSATMWALLCRALGSGLSAEDDPSSSFTVGRPAL